MTAGSKGALLGAAAILTISLLWAAAAGRVDDITCVHFEPVPPGEFVSLGVMIGVPCAVLVGAAIGRTAAGLLHHRRVFLLILAASLACLLTVIVRIVAMCSTDPTTSTLWVRAFVPLTIAILTLERWTRPAEPVPRATIHRE